MTQTKQPPENPGRFIMNRAVDNDIAAILRLSAIGAANALDMIARMVRPRPI